MDPALATTMPDGVAAEARAAMSSRGALTSSVSDDWGSPEAIRRFASVVLAPAASEPESTSIDLDPSTSQYWNEQWEPRARPAQFFDGKGMGDCYSIDHWEAKAPQIGSAFWNPNGDPTGENVQAAWSILEARHRAGKIGSAVWVGFSLEQLRSLLPDAAERKAGVRSPLDPRVACVFPGRRVSYMCHPNAMIAIIEKRLTKPGGSDRKQLERRRDELLNRSDDSPVKGPAPTHSSYLAILWDARKKIRDKQQTAARKFLAAQASVPKSIFERHEVIGAIG